MSDFLIYLLESGLCLSLFYLGYIVFFRKETYFNFNRIYLLASIVLSMVLPLIPLQFSPEETTGLSPTIQQISSFRNYYEDMIRLTDPEYAVSYEQLGSVVKVQDKGVFNESSWNLSSIIFYVYITGLLFFVVRLGILILYLRSHIRKNHIVQVNGIHLVLMKEKVPSFSFLKWVFLNKEMLKPNEFEQVLAHEKVHVDHKHSWDLLIAQGISLLQWFNPLTWRIQKSMKTCHEYIADRKVLEQGHALFDYQSLLLSQLISIRSVELVNNFNLLSIKKRIAMMNKIKSGRLAKLKALLVIPILVFTALFFANYTVANKKVKQNVSQKVMNNESLVEQKVNIPTVKSVKQYDKDFILCTFTLNKNGFFYKGVKKDINKIDDIIRSIKKTEDASNIKMKSVLLEIDESVTMDKVDKIRYALRKHDLLKFGFVAKNEKSDHQTALFMLLPPMDAVMLDENTFDNLFKIEQAKKPYAGEVYNDLSKYIEENAKYVMLYTYDNNTSFKDYIAIVDVVFKAVNDKRKQMAFFEGINYQKLYSQKSLSADQKKYMNKYKKRYPITLTQKNLDMD